MFPFSFIKKKGLGDSEMVGIGGKGKPWGTDGSSRRIPLNDCCCVEGIAGGRLWVNMDVVNHW